MSLWEQVRQTRLLPDQQFAKQEFLADRTDGRAVGTVLRLSSVCRL